MSRVHEILQQVFKEKVGCRTVKETASSPGGILNRCYIYKTDKGKFFVKVNKKTALPMYEAEARGLEALKKTSTVRVPTPVAWGRKQEYSFLIMEFVRLSHHTPSSQKELGTLLAKMHLAKAPRRQFGFEQDNTIGTTPQINAWNSDWVDFFLHNRLEFQLKLLEMSFSDTEIINKGKKFMRRFPSFFEGIEVVPSLLHGDLWNGNTAADEKENPIIYDPAVYYGHHEAEFGILLMFGGFTRDFHEAYRELIPRAPGFEERQLGYQLYHYLNHYNLFGRSYRPSCMSILSRFS